MDEDFEDLLGDEGLEDEDMADNELLPATSSSSTNQASAIPPLPLNASTAIKDESHAMSMPSENELRLGRRVFELEKERDALATELSIYKTRFPSGSTTIPIPIADEITSPQIPINIPSEILPLLSLLRRHIAELTRDNQALRYTFLGQPGLRRRSLTVNPGQRGVVSPRMSTPRGGTTLSPIPVAVPVPNTASLGSVGGVASSSKMTLDVPMTPSLSSDSAQAPMAVEYAITGLDLEGVVERVKELVRENEELGEMILEAGKRETDEWERALQESKAVITSLDSDLTHHATVVTSVRDELDKYKLHFGPIPRSTNAEASSRDNRIPSSASNHGISIRGMGGSSTSSSSARLNIDRDSRGNAGLGLKRHGGSERERDTPSEARGAVGAGAGAGAREQRQSTSSQGQGQGHGARGSGSRGSNSNGHGNDRAREFGGGGGGGRNDDRGSKRRR